MSGVRMMKMIMGAVIFKVRERRDEIGKKTHAEQLTTNSRKKMERIYEIFLTNSKPEMREQVSKDKSTKMCRRGV